MDGGTLLVWFAMVAPVFSGAKDLEGAPTVFGGPSLARFRYDGFGRTVRAVEDVTGAGAFLARLFRRPTTLRTLLERPGRLGLTLARDGEATADSLLRDRLEARSASPSSGRDLAKGFG